MNNDLDEIEEELKKSAEGRSSSGRKTHKVSGRSVFVLKDIIKKKAGEERKDEKENPQKEK